MIVAILAVYKLLNLKATKQASYAMYLEQYERLDAQLRDRAKDNVPTERQRAGFVSYVELLKVRKKLTFGSKEKLLLSFYGGCIPPLRNDLRACAIQLLKCDDDESAQQALLHQVTPNEILLPVDRNSAGVLILREFKTQDRKHPVLYTRSLGSDSQGSSELVSEPCCSQKATLQSHIRTVHSPCTQDAPCKSFSESRVR